MGLRTRILLMAGVTVISAIALAVAAVVLERATVARWSIDRLLEAHGAVWQALVDDVVTVDTDQIGAGIRDIFEDTRSIVEPAGALAVAGAKKYLADNVEYRYQYLL